MELLSIQELINDYNLKEHHIFELVIAGELGVFHPVSIKNLPPNSVGIDDRIEQINPQRISFQDIKSNTLLFYRRKEVEKLLLDSFIQENAELQRKDNNEKLHQENNPFI